MMMTVLIAFELLCVLELLSVTHSE